MKLLLTMLVAAIFLAGSAMAEIMITEIMYDPDGANTGRQWVEIFNSGPSSIDLTGWKLVVNGGNHNLAASAGDMTINSGEAAVIVDDPTKFMTDYPTYSGTLIDSSFSLTRNSTVQLKDKDLNLIDTETYVGQDGVGCIETDAGVEDFQASTGTPGIVTLANISAPVPEFGVLGILSVSVAGLGALALLRRKD